MEIGGVQRQVAVKVYSRLSSAADQFFMRAAGITRRLGEMGIGPRVYGIADVGGRPAIIMERVIGDHGDYMRTSDLSAVSSAASEATVTSLENALVRLYMEGISPGPDFQYMIVTDGPDRGQVRIIDMGDYVDLREAAQRSGERYTQLDEEGARARAQTHVLAAREEMSRIRVAAYVEDPQRRESFEWLAEMVREYEGHIVNTAGYRQ